MALGLLLWFSWISVLLDSSAGLTTSKGNTYRLPAASQNLPTHVDFEGGDTTKDNELIFEGVLEEPDNKPTNLVYTSYKPAVPKPLNLGQTGQSSPSSQSTPAVDRLVNGELRRWESKLSDPITFPLSSGTQEADPSKPKPLPILPAIQPQSTLLTGYTSSNSVAPTPSRLPSYKPAQSSGPLAVSSPSFASWQPASAPKITVTQGVAEAPQASRYQAFNTGSSLSGGDLSNNIFERGYPSSSQDVKPVSLLYTASSNAADMLTKRPSMQELPQSYTATRYGLGNRMDTTGYASAPQKPPLKYPLNAKPYERLPYAAQRYRQDGETNPEFPNVYRSPQKPSENAMSELSFDDSAGSYNQGTMDQMPSVGYPSAQVPSAGYTSAQKPFSQSAVGTEFSPKDWMALPPFSGIFGDGFPDFNQMDALSENSVLNMQQGGLPQVYQMPPPKPLRKTFAIHTKNRYQRGRYMKSKTTYTPDYKMPQMNMKGMSVYKRPAQAPKPGRKAN